MKAIKQLISKHFFYKILLNQIKWNGGGTNLSWQIK